jgi:hypothetical protein
MAKSRNESQVEPPLLSLADLDDAHVEDICIGLADGPGGRFRVLQRMRTTRREAVRLAGRTASHLAEAARETVLDPQQRPSAIRVSDGPDGDCIWLEYDIGTLASGRPKAARALRIMLVAR